MKTFSLNSTDIELFQKTIWDFYTQHGRAFAWRNINDPYRVLISEVMLQQTQTTRVQIKYQEFLDLFPTLSSLALAPLSAVLRVWQGLGYNRRARFLHECAKLILSNHAGMVPDDPYALVKLPGIGKATAASVCAFAYNMPTVFIETNIRAVFLHMFFAGETGIEDAQIITLVAATIDHTRPREWYYALMDYGVMLKQKFKNPCIRSAHYVVQSKFEGSDRQIRGAIVRTLLLHGPVEIDHLKALVCGDADHDRFVRILHGLGSDNLVRFDKKLALIC